MFETKAPCQSLAEIPMDVRLVVSRCKWRVFSVWCWSFWTKPRFGRIVLLSRHSTSAARDRQELPRNAIRSASTSTSLIRQRKESGKNFEMIRKWSTRLLRLPCEKCILRKCRQPTLERHSKKWPLTLVKRKIWVTWLSDPSSKKPLAIHHPAKSPESL